MSDLIYLIFTYLTDVPVNFWSWFMFLTAPVFVFAVEPKSLAKVRFWRLLFAIGLTYVFINLSLHTGREIIWKAYQECQSQFPDGAIQNHKECGETNIADGASNIFYAFFGWIPAMVYVGWWEILWNRYHRRYTGKITDDYKNTFSSNAVMQFSKILTAVIFTWLGLIISGLLFSPWITSLLMDVFESFCS